MKLKELRKSKGYSQEEISSLFKIPLRTYKRYEKDLDSNSYKYKLIVDKLNNLSKKTKAKSLKKRNVAIVGCSDISCVIGLLLAENNRVVFLSDNKEETARQISICTKEITAIKKFSPLKTAGNLKVVSENKYLNSVDLTVICLKDDFKIEAVEDYVSYLDENNSNSVVVIKNTVPIGYGSKLNSKFKHTEIVYFPTLSDKLTDIESILYPEKTLFGVYRNNIKSRTTVSIFDTLVLNNCKGILMPYEEAESAKMFSDCYAEMQKNFANEIEQFAKSKDLNSENILKGVFGLKNN